MQLRTLTVGPVSCKCSIVACLQTGEAAVVDPGGNAGEILAEVAAMGVTVKLLLHSHAHFDHILATREVAEATGAQILLHEGDRAMYENLPAQGRAFGFFAERPPEPTRWLKDGETIAIGNLSARVIHTPGHTPGSVGFYFPGKEPWEGSFDLPRGEQSGEARQLSRVSLAPLLLAGDTLFAESVGRTDLPGGSFDDLVVSIREKLYVLPEATRVIPGHGPETTIGWEREHNPFVSAYP